jgi:glycosyltransferase involved in cell wall biosynthesis
MSLRLLHVLSSPHMGGAERMCLDLAKAQKASGHEAHVLFMVTGAGSAYAAKEGIPFTIAVSADVTSPSRSRRWTAMSCELERAAAQLRPQLVHSHVPLTHLLCNRVLPRISVPWISTMHGSWRQFGYAPQTYGRLYLRPFLLMRHALGDLVATRSAQRIVAVADSVKRDLQRVGIPARRLVTIHNGLVPPASPLAQGEARARLHLPPDGLLIGAMGYHAPVKGFDLLVRAFAQVAPRHPRALLLIAGGDVLGNEQPRRGLERLIAHLGLADRVQLLAARDPHAGFMSALDLFVVPSRSEGMPLVLLEAMGHGKPSLVSSAGGCTEAAQPGHEAMVFHSGSIADLTANLGILLKDKLLRDSLGKAARERASSYLSLERCASQYENLYVEVATSARH